MDPLERLKESLLLRRLHAGEGTAFAEAYELFAPRLYRHALYRTSSPETAQDVVSETFLKAWNFVQERAREIRNLRAFLYRIADNLVIDFYRKRAKEPDALPENAEELLPYHAGIAERADLQLDRARLERSLAGLKEDAKQLIVMRYLDELSIKEISDLTGKTSNAVYVSIHRAVKELQRVCDSSSSAD